MVTSLFSSSKARNPEFVFSNFGLFDSCGLAYLFSDLKTVEKIQESMFYNTSSGDSALTNFSSRSLAVL